MKILHINGTLSGGVFNVALSLHEKLLKKKIDSYIFLKKNMMIKNEINSNSSFNFNKSKILLSKLFKKILKKNNQTSTLGIFKSSELNKIFSKNNPDIIHLHWVGGELLSLDQLFIQNPGVTGSNLVISKSKFLKLKGFDKNMKSSEDKDIVVKAILNNLKISYSNSKVFFHLRKI